MSNFNILTETEITNELQNFPSWRLEENQLTADFTFKDFKQTFAFMTMVALEAEKINHHPEWVNVYNKLTITFSTNEANDKITDLDIKMVKYINEIIALFK